MRVLITGDLHGNPEGLQFIHSKEKLDYDLCKTEGFPSFKVGNRILIQRNKLIEWIEQQAAQ